MKIMAIDYGDQHTGLAVSDVTETLVGNAWIVDEWNMERLADTICGEADRCDAGILVLGLPKNMDGTEGPRAVKSRVFRELLICEKARELKTLLEERTDREIVLWDERWTTVAAHDILHANGRKEKKHKKVIDAVAASLILEGFLGTRH